MTFACDTPADMRGQLTSVAKIRAFVLAGNATFTLVSKATEKRYTFKVSACDGNDGLWFVSVLYGPDNEQDFVYMGIIRTALLGLMYQRGGKSTLMPTDVRCKAFYWFWLFIARGLMPPKLEFWHEGQCCRCGRKLTVPSSVASGIGPECAKRMAA